MDTQDTNVMDVVQMALWRVLSVRVTAGTATPSRAAADDGDHGCHESPTLMLWHHQGLLQVTKLNPFGT